MREVAEEQSFVLHSFVLFVCCTEQRLQVRHCLLGLGHEVPAILVDCIKCQDFVCWVCMRLVMLVCVFFVLD